MPIFPRFIKVRTFDDYLLSQASQGFLFGPPLSREVKGMIPGLLARMVKCRFRRSELRRSRGLRVPSVLFLAITGSCNLHCPHCYTNRYKKAHMPMSLARRIVSEALELGVSFIVVTGGEPLLNREFFSLPAETPNVPFLVFTNGTLVPEFLTSVSQTPNLIWVVSVDGPRPQNDARRGEGSYDAACAAIATLCESGRPVYFSCTVSSDNISEAMAPEFVATMAAQGCRFGFFLEQIPGPVCDPPLGQQISKRLAWCRKHSRIPLVGFPADEVHYGGCQAGGNGIAHISPEGYVEPCPAAHIATDSLQDVSLETALSNPFLRDFSELKATLATGDESCTYTEHSHAINTSLQAIGAHPTTQ